MSVSFKTPDKQGRLNSVTGFCKGDVLCGSSWLRDLLVVAATVVDFVMCVCVFMMQCV